MEAIRQLGYTPDRAAKALSSGKSNTVGAVVPTLGLAIFADAVEALQDGLTEQGYTLLLANTGYDSSRELTQVRALLQHGVDGLILVGDSFAPEVPKLIKQFGVPCLTTFVAASKHGFPCIGIDNHAAAKAMAAYMLGLGHREFGIVANTALPNDRSQARLDGFVQGLAEAGIGLLKDRIVEVEHPVISNGRTGLRHLLSRFPGITAILCTTDTLAMGAAAEAKRVGIDVPGRLSISGYDDIEIAAEVDPPLTSVTIPAKQIGRLAAQQVVLAIGGGHIPINTRFAASQVIRGSTAAVRQAAPEKSGHSEPRTAAAPVAAKT
jgi:LacI family transcriptional regulator